MKELYELNALLERASTRLDNIRGCLDLERINARVKKLEELTLAPDFWSDRERARDISTELSKLQAEKSEYFKLENKIKDIKESLQLLKLESDDDFQLEVQKELEKIEGSITSFENQMYLSGKYDSYNAILDFHPGAGGTEAHDWALMLFRMYNRFAEKHKMKVEIVNYLEGDEAGISAATIIVKGKNAFGLLKSERGVHRLVRISPFDASGSRHTSFASVNVMPEFDDKIELNINPKDLRVDTYRSQGAGGQNVNKVESAVRITHIPTGIFATCEVERSQIQNREIAMNLLKSRLFQRLENERLEKLRKINGEKKDIEWGSQIRSYVFCPYTLVKDHRTNFEVTNVASVMDGDIDGFIMAYLRKEFDNERQAKL
ncbi:MAG: peptide chain release factor 2 [Bacilli bacterium]